jgi:serine/threonine-protein kinase
MLNFRPVLDITISILGQYGMMIVDAVAGFAGGVGLLAAIGYLSVRDRKVQPVGTFWAKVWKGVVGRAAFTVAAKLVHGGRVSALTHRATELSLGMAAEQLYEDLPKETRRALGDIPGVLHRLQDDAQELRKRHDALQDAIAESGDSSGAEYADVRDMRDELHAKLGDAVGALETIRLNLLRLHAGSLSVESVTTHLGLAAEVSAEVERLIAAHAYVERVLKFPRTAATTPV